LELLALPGAVSLRQREWNRADGQKQKQIKRAPKNLRLDGGVNLPFYVVWPS
jgi:hypothetical protein